MNKIINPNILKMFMLGKVESFNLDMKFPVLFNCESLDMHLELKPIVKSISEVTQQMLLFTTEYNCIDAELIPLDMPKLITMAFNLRNYADYFLKFLSNDIFTNSAQYFTTTRDGDRIYFVGHSAGLLSESTYVTNRIEVDKNKESSQLFFEPQELNIFNKKRIQHDLISLEDLRAGKTLDRFITYANLDAEIINLKYVAGFSEKEFMESDSVLMQCGGVKARARLARLYFHDLNYKFVQNNIFMSDELFKEHYGEQLILSPNDEGINSHFSLSNEGRMLAASPELIKGDLELYYSYFKMDNHGVPESKIKR